MNEIIVTHVESGETLSEIAARYGVTVDELQQWNRIEDPDLLRAGQQIVVYGPAELAASTAGNSAYTSAPASDPQPAFLNGWFGIVLLVALMAVLLRRRRRPATPSARSRIDPKGAIPDPTRRPPVRAPLFRFFRSPTENKGERRVRSRLQRRYPDWTLLNDVLLPSGRGTTQIDHILLSPGGLFLIETKDMNGWIFGSPGRNQWTQSFAAGRRDRRAGITSRQFKFYNPLFQNEGHANALVNLDVAKCSWLRPVSVFVGDAELKTGDEFLPFDAQDKMADRFRTWRKRGVLCVGLSELDRYIAFCMDAPSHPRLTARDLESISAAIQAIRIPVTAETRARHNEFVRSTRESALR